MGVDLTSFDAMLKEFYTTDKIEELAFEDNPVMGLLPKKDDWVGDSFVQPVKHGNNQGKSATFANAQSNTGNNVSKKFVVTHKKYYGVATIDSLTMKASKGDKGAFLDAADDEISGTLQSVTNALSTHLFGDGSGALAQVSNSSFSTVTLTLVNASDVDKFEVGQVLITATTKSGGAGTINSGTLTVEAVDRDAESPTITMSGNLSGWSGVAQNDYIYIQGDYDNVITGFGGWLPYTAPSSGDSFFGVDRSVDPQRLSGVRYDGSNVSIMEAMVGASTRLAKYGGRPDIAVVNFEKYEDLINELGSKAETDYEDKGHWGYEYLKFRYPKGKIKVVADRNCPSDRSYLLTTNTWKIISTDTCPHIVKNDGNSMLRQSSADGVEVRIASYAEVVCRAPGHNAVVNLPA